MKLKPIYINGRSFFLITWEAKISWQELFNPPPKKIKMIKCRSHHLITYISTLPVCTERVGGVKCGNSPNKNRLVAMDVSEKNGTPKSSILIGFSIIFTIHFGGKPSIFGSTPKCHTLRSPTLSYVWHWAQTAWTAPSSAWAENVTTIGRYVERFDTSPIIKMPWNP